MLSYLLLLVLSRASVEDRLELPNVRRGGRRRGFWNDFTKGVTNVGNTIGKEFDKGVGQITGGESFDKWINPFDCETKDEFTDCRDIGTSNTRWMSRIPDGTKITELSIPGTHDSASLHGGGAPWHVICHSLTIRKQLDAGIRYLDIRARHFNDALPIHHGPVFQNIMFSGVLKEVRQFLAQNPTETIFMRVKKEHDASGNRKTFNQLVQEVINWDLGRYGMVAPGTGNDPWEYTMGQVRGKVVFMQDFSGEVIPGSVAWSSPTDYEGAVIQDDFEINAHWQLDRKRNAIRQNLDQARRDPWRLYANHLSGTGASFGGIKQVAKPMNAYARQLFGSRNRGSGYGIIISDFPGKSLITDIIYKNPGY